MTQESQYERINQIIQDQMALEKHQRGEKATLQQIEDSRVSAYRLIVQLVTGVDIFNIRSNASPPASPPVS